MTATPHLLPSSAKRAAQLDALGTAGRLRAYQGGELDAADVAIWVGLYPEQVPTTNGKFEWIAATLEWVGDGPTSRPKPPAPPSRERCEPLRRSLIGSRYLRPLPRTMPMAGDPRGFEMISLKKELEHQDSQP